MKVERAAGWILLGLLLVVPTVWMVGYALLYSLGLLGLLSSGLTLEWWRQALSGAVLWHSLLLSLGVASVTTLSCLVAGLAVCVAADRWRVQRAVGVLLTIGAALPVSVGAFVVLQVCSRGGLLPRVLALVIPGFEQSDFPVLVNDGWSVGIVLAGWLTGVPLTGLYLQGQWETASVGRYVSLAERLGAGAWRARMCVGVPMLIRRVGGLTWLLLVWNFSAWEAPLLLGSQSPRMMSVLIQQSAGQYSLQERPLSFVYASLYFLVLVALLCWLPRRTKLG